MWVQGDKLPTILYKVGTERQMRYHSAQSGYTDRNDVQFPKHNLHSYHSTE